MRHFLASILIALCAITGTVYDNGVVAPGARVDFVTVDTQQIPTIGLVRMSAHTVIANSQGVIPSISLPQGIVVRIMVDNGNPQQVTIPAQSTVDLNALLKAAQ